MVQKITEKTVLDKLVQVKSLVRQIRNKSEKALKSVNQKQSGAVASALDAYYEIAGSDPSRHKKLQI